MVAVEAQVSGLKVIASKYVPLDANIGNFEQRELNSSFLYGADEAIIEKYRIENEAFKLSNVYKKMEQK